MKYLKKILKSKTIDFNVLAGAAVLILSSFGVDMSAEAVASLMAAVNVILRFVTNVPISEK